jgi:hypothetical protein
MTTVLGYIQTGAVASAGAGAFSAPAGAWCRPRHRATCCMAIFAGGSCCVCVPTSATCYVIEMWGQGGAGGGGCCCGVGSYGGQGGSYGWVTCTTSGTNHILCACSCLCGPCSPCGICNGNPGQFSRVINCNGTGGIGGVWCVCGGAQGLWCCFPNAPWCWAGNCQNPSGAAQFKHNTWRLFNQCSACLASVPVATAAVAAGQALQFCCTNGTVPGIDAGTFVGCAACTAPSAGGGGSAAANVLDNFIPGQLCSCSAFSSPFVWTGACGWSDPALLSGPSHCLNIACNNPSNGPVNANCGGGAGVGGAAYAGGDQAWQKCSFECGSCWVQCGNFPGGGGMSTWSQTAWGQPGWGAPGLILISWS